MHAKIRKPRSGKERKGKESVMIRNPALTQLQASCTLKTIFSVTVNSSRAMLQARRVSIVLGVCILSTIPAMLSFASASADTFQQDAAAILALADTNTQEDFTHQPEPAPRSPAKELNVFILPHSHDDPGWVRTADQYFDFLVGPMYTSVMAELAKDSTRRFQAVEVVYFKQWYVAATAEQQQQAQRAVMGLLQDVSQYLLITSGYSRPVDLQRGRLGDA